MKKGVVCGVGDMKSETPCGASKWKRPVDVWT